MSAHGYVTTRHLTRVLNVERYQNTCWDDAVQRTGLLAAEIEGPRQPRRACRQRAVERVGKTSPHACHHVPSLLGVGHDDGGHSRQRASSHALSG